MLFTNNQLQEGVYLGNLLVSFTNISFTVQTLNVGTPNGPGSRTSRKTSPIQNSTGHVARTWTTRRTKTLSTPGRPDSQPDHKGAGDTAWRRRTHFYSGSLGLCGRRYNPRLISGLRKNFICPETEDENTCAHSC